MMMRFAFAQLALLGLLPLLNAQINSMMMFTRGIHMMIMVRIQLPSVTEGWIVVVVTLLSIVFVFCLFIFVWFISFICMKIHRDSSDEELLQQYVKTHRPEYLVELYGRYMPLVYGVALKYLKNAEDAQDLVMQVYEEIGESLLRHRVKVFKGWLYVCVRNDCLAELRRRKGNFLVELDEGFMDFCDDFHLDDMREREEREEMLRECLKALPERQRMCVERFFMEEFSYQDIVEKLGFSLKMVKSFIQNGKRNLKLCLERKGVRSC